MTEEEQLKEQTQFIAMVTHSNAQIRWALAYIRENYDSPPAKEVSSHP
jgi:hypothetical protein